MDAQLGLWDANECFAELKPVKSADWKWTYADYPKKKNGVKVFSCFACGGAAQWVISSAGVMFWDA